MRFIHAQDIRYALRLLRRTPGFTVLTVLVLAGGLGLSTFTFSFLHTAMIRALPLAEGERIVRVTPVIGDQRGPIDVVDVQPFREGVRAVGEVSAYTGRDVILGRDDARRVVGVTVAEPGVLAIARVQPRLGRTLLAADAAAGAEPVMVLSYRIWDVAFAKDPAIVGRLVPIDGRETRVVGVMPDGFGFPVATEAWLPLPATTLATTSPGLESVRLVARLAPNQSHDVAASDASVVLQRIIAMRDTSARTRAVSVLIESFPAAQFGEERTLVFSTLNLLAALILLLALVNVTNLLIARSNERVGETAVRLALGASTGRLVMQGMWETILLCLTGGALGTAGAAWGLSAITRWTSANMAENLAFWWVWAMNGTTIAAAGAFVTVAIAVLGSVVSTRVTRMNVREIMQDGSARAGSRREGRFSRFLVATQVTTVTVLMFIGAIGGVIAKRIVTLDPGFDTTNLMQGGFTLPDARYATAEQRAVAYRAVEARLTGDPAFEHTLLRRALAEPRSDAGQFALRGARTITELPTAHVYATLGDVGTLGASITQGRMVSARDDNTNAPVVVISASLARRFWEGRSPVGDQIRLAGMDETEFRTIVGVVSDVLYGNPLSRDRTTDAIYVPLLQTATPSVAFLVRTRSGEMAARQALLAAFTSIDPALIPESVQRYDELLRKLGLIATSTAKLFAGAFAFALLLALVGTYGLMSRAIGARTREIGVRRALGAPDRDVMRLLLGQGARQLGVGTVIAAPVLVLTGLGARHYFPIGGVLVTVLGIVVSTSIIALVLAATWVPTRRVLRVGLGSALRSE